MKAIGVNSLIVNSRSDALLNEYKGNLFEFLVAKEYAHKFHFEDRFLNDYETSAFATLNQQEEFVRNYYPEYLDFLPQAASYCVNAINQTLKIQSCSDVWVVGKKQAVKKEDYTEVDLKIDSEKTYHLSLKFSRYSSFVNTKSAGVKSFFKNYFKGVLATQLQDQFDQYWEFEWEVFARKMHELADIEFTKDFETWKKQRPEVLPGELEGEFKNCLYQFYQKINQKMADLLDVLAKENPEDFRTSLASLMGFSSPEIIQVCLFYQKNDRKFELKKVDIHDYSEIQKQLLNHVDIHINKTNLEVIFAQSVLQIRLKPMNTFVGKGFKINCSVKLN